ncbi:ParA family protein [Deinococcus yavapaiensis]|uniref:Chromosome partitioning protein n=1 Tax=Deinococcus yavapaiensis KR-236 TaxID=694435 RepID=A0A318S2I6_9DEIO|nr:ParA family protein [Deinococcus yavapaiensis]PYE52047.1 chromosome partitioning protein [Deinococcus yavapaiensis KR-236]
MIISLISWKGGCGKTTSSIHFAALLARRGQTMLVDEDRSRNATNWTARGGDALPFKTFPPRALGTEARRHDHIVIDTRGGLEDQDLVDLYDNSDLVIVPAIAESMTLEALAGTAQTLRKHGRDLGKLRVLFTLARKTNGKSDKVAEAKAAVAELGITPLTRTIRATEAFRDACDSGRLVRDVKNPNGKLAWMDYERAFAELTS